MYPLIKKTMSINVSASSDVLIARAKAMQYASELSFRMADQVRIATSVSELARNMIQHANGGVCTIYDISEPDKIGIKIQFVDTGTGIADINLAMQDGYSTNRSLGLGLPGTYRLVDEMEINTSPAGTEIIISLMRKRPTTQAHSILKLTN